MAALVLRARPRRHEARRRRLVPGRALGDRGRGARRGRPGRRARGAPSHPAGGRPGQPRAQPGVRW
ncbi:MAG: hypothetical protein EOO74_12405 [Myxococcales bacterium]|nr:MAG: hypothetical protein EOO74_12405 [Myxococcales bacterium]